MSNVSLEDIVSLCKRRGFIYQGSEVYGGLAGTWDYGPLGVTLKRNVMQLWWKMFVDDLDDMYGVDAAILMNQKVWQASGHTETFNDPLVECTNCKTRFRVDKVVDHTYLQYVGDLEQMWRGKYSSLRDDIKELMPHSSLKMIDPQVIDYKANNFDDIQAFVNSLSNEGERGRAIAERAQRLAQEHEEIERARKHLGSFARDYLNSHKKCDKCGVSEWGEPRAFNMMFKTHIGPVSQIITTQYNENDGADPKSIKSWLSEDPNSVVYLRPETAQGIFTNYKNVVDSFYPDMPFGIAQQGKAFRNEISPRDFVFRSREFEQMEIEYFVHPDQWENAFELWRNRVHNWFKALGLPADMLHELEVPKDDLAHYSKRTIDFEFDYPHGRDEILGMAYRTNFDLGNIQRASGKNMEYRPKDGGEAFVPHVIEPSFGVERAIMAVLVAAYTVDELHGEKRTLLKLPKHLAPVRCAVSPLLKNKPELVEKAREVYASLKKEFGNVMWDDNGNIGKRYRRQDEIGTPYCVTIDFQTLEDNTVTVRDRDTAEQTRVAMEDVTNALRS